MCSQTMTSTSDGLSIISHWVVVNPDNFRIFTSFSMHNPVKLMYDAKQRKQRKSFKEVTKQGKNRFLHRGKPAQILKLHKIQDVLHF